MTIYKYRQTEGLRRHAGSLSLLYPVPLMNLLINSLPFFRLPSTLLIQCSFLYVARMGEERGGV